MIIAKVPLTGTKKTVTYDAAGGVVTGDLFSARIGTNIPKRQNVEVHAKINRLVDFMKQNPPAASTAFFAWFANMNTTTVSSGASLVETEDMVAISVGATALPKDKASHFIETQIDYCRDVLNERYYK